jgi:hypothetical protein
LKEGINHDHVQLLPRIVVSGPPPTNVYALKELNGGFTAKEGVVLLHHLHGMGQESSLDLLIQLFGRPWEGQSRGLVLQVVD